MKKISSMLKKMKQENNGNEKGTGNQETKTILSPDLEKNINQIKQILGESPDIIFRAFSFGNEPIKAAIVYIDGLVNGDAVNKSIIEALMLEIREVNKNREYFSFESISEVVKETCLPAGELKDVLTIEVAVKQILSGDTLLLIHGTYKGISIDAKGWKDRGVPEPTSETIVRGPKEAFSETLRTNTALIRRRIKSPHLRFENRQLGNVTQTDIAIAYIDGIAQEKIVQEVRNRLNKINIDAILESGYIEELIQDQTWTPFPTIYNTERPDVIAAGLLEGRIAIFIDGTPFVLLVPALFIQFFHASEDYYHRFDIVVGVRLLRFIGFFLALLTPAAFVAVTTFHQEMLPTPLLISLSSQREGIPFPAYIEALLMITAFEILHEAGIRLPRAVGSAISIVGALVLGQAAVEAGLVSPVMIIVVSMTAISNFVFPSFSMAISVRLLRLIMMTLAAVFGVFGIIIALITMVLHLCSLRSFGIPYMSPFAPFIPSDQKDALFRLPHWGLFSRPRLINQNNIRREATKKPSPPKN